MDFGFGNLLGNKNKNPKVPHTGWTGRAKGTREIFPSFFYYGQKNIFVDLHVSGNSKTFSPL
jgi:hypothetical protein